MNKLSIILILAVELLSFSLHSQELNKQFLESLPEDIREDLMNESLDSNKEKESKYNPDTRIKNLESSLADAESALERIRNDLDRNKVTGRDADGADLKRFGSKFFGSYQSTYLPVNLPNFLSEYVLDYGDGLNIQVIGTDDKDFEVSISRDGSISLQGIGKIFVGKTSFQDASNTIKQTIAKKIIGAEVFVSLVSLRDISVFIVGNVANPGMYTLSGGSSVLSILDAAGGIDENGSYREILIKRNNKTIEKIDLYDFFAYGNITSNQQLRSGDAVVVQPRYGEVSLSGSFTTPGLFEFKSEESLLDIMNIAGYRSDHSNSTIRIERLINGKANSIDIDIINADKFSMIDGDSIEIYHVEPEFSPAKIVKITGEVGVPGTYSVPDNFTLYDLILLAGNYKDNAYPLGGVFMRESVKQLEESMRDRSYNDMLRYLVTSGANNLGTADAGNIGQFLAMLKMYQPSGRVVTDFNLNSLKNNKSKNRVLQHNDQIHIPSLQDEVYVFGEVMNPGPQFFSNNKKAKDYLDGAGSFTRNADTSRTIVIYPNGNSISFKNTGSFRSFFSNEENLLPGTVIYVPRHIGKLEGINLASAVAPIVSSFALSIASLNSINN